MNWEFRRNLWIQLTPQRLVATPVVLALVFPAAAQFGGLHGVAIAVFWLLAGLWGTRRAADSIVEEIVGGTWQSQRMSAMAAWPMAWGKLYGATAFPWYGALMAWLAIAYSIGGAEIVAGRWVELGNLLFFALLAQATSFLAALMQVRRRGRGRQMALGVAQAAGLATLIFHPGNWLDARIIPWFWHEMSAPVFLGISASLFFAWALVAIHQLMRAELQYRETTWRLPLFAVFLMIYVAGLAVSPDVPGSPILRALVADGAAALALFYASLLSAPGEPVALLRWWRALAQQRWSTVGELMPPWVPTGAIALVLGIALIFYAQTMTVIPRPLAGWIGVDAFSGWIAGILLFAARDTALVLVFALGPRPERADINALIWLSILHGLLPAVCHAFGLYTLAGFAAPTPGSPTLLLIVAPVLQVLGLGYLIVGRLRALTPATAAGVAG